MSDNLAYRDDFREKVREELIGGEVFLMAPASTNHVLVSGNVYSIFGNYLKGKKCVPFMDGVKVFLTEQDHFVPDMMVVCDWDKIKPDGIHGTPDLVVEILSPSTMRNDKTRKKEVYAKCGVREYWIISLGDKAVEQYLLRDGDLGLNSIYVLPPDWMPARMTEKEHAEVVTHFKCSLYDDLDINLEDIFYRTF
ncbi:MAG: Uma2 family endonuclease [Oscillospiraceae bacterium]|jgi:Uma2 family endonuclease|nr:Uma2 family endonuclease [Oscillospiraceae bacterium]